MAAYPISISNPPQSQQQRQQQHYHSQGHHPAIRTFLNEADDHQHDDDADDDDDAPVLDPAILNVHDTHYQDSRLAMNPSSGADAQAWEQHPYLASALPVDPTDSAQMAFQDHPISSFPPQWRFDQPSSNCNTADPSDFLPPPPLFDGQQYQHPRQDSAHEGFAHPPFAADPSFMSGQPPMSPHSHQDYMTLAQREMDARPMQKRVRPNSPSLLFDMTRRDGIRKKNNRIDIPLERTLGNIDNMIDNAPDDDTLKELKQQKRLLRNREAALASRQRKKKHTEDLEVKEKGYSHQIVILEKENSDMSLEIQAREDERQLLLRNLDDAHRATETLQEQLREAHVRHNEETSSLRRKVNVLTDHVDHGLAPAMSAEPSSTGFTDFNSEMEALNMGSHDWDNFVFLNDMRSDAQDDFTFDPRPTPQPQSRTLGKKASTNTIVPVAKQPTESTVDPPIASGLLFMLLLCGAFVASKSPSSQPRDMIIMPDSVRAAAPMVLNQLMSEAASQNGARTMPASVHEPQQSNVPYSDPTTSSRLDQMHHRLTAPTKQQEIDQAFSLTTAQYASIANMQHPSHNDEQGGIIPHDGVTTHPRRNLAEALAEAYPEPNSKAQVYTRSLLWDQVPADVVKQFKQMVRDHHEIEVRQQSNKRNSDGTISYRYKVEP